LGEADERVQDEAGIGESGLANVLPRLSPVARDGEPESPGKDEVRRIARILNEALSARKAPVRGGKPR
jgi:hypothetical protein